MRMAIARSPSISALNLSGGTSDLGEGSEAFDGRLEGVCEVTLRWAKQELHDYMTIT